MSKKKEETRDYHGSDGAMIEKTDEIISFGRRDSTELTPEGVTTARLDALELKRNDFMDLEDDEEWSGLLSEKVEEKNDAMDVCETTVHNIRRMAQNVFGEGTAKYRRYRFDDINDLEEDKKPKAYGRIWRRATADLTALTPEGLSTTILDDFKDAIDDLDTKLNVVEDTIADRDAATEERIVMGNEIWAEVVKIANTGKDYWFNKSEAKYNDYVLTDTVVNVPDNVQHITVPAGQNRLLADNLTAGDVGDAYVKKNGQVGSVLVLYYAPNSTTPYAGPGGVILNTNTARIISSTDPGAVQACLMVQNTSLFEATLDFAAVEE